MVILFGKMRLQKNENVTVAFDTLNEGDVDPQNVELSRVEFSL